MALDISALKSERDRLKETLRELEVHQRKCVIGHGLFDGEGNCTAVLKAIMVSLNEETHRSMPFEPAVRAALEKFAASKDGLGS